MSESDAATAPPSRRAARHARRASTRRRRAPMRPPIDQERLPPIGPVASGGRTAPIPPLVDASEHAASGQVEPATWSIPPVVDGPADHGPAEETAGSAVSAERWTALRAEGSGFGEAVGDSAPEPKPAPRFEGTVLNEPETSDGRSLTWITWVLIGLAFVALLLFLILGTGSGAEASDPAAASVAPGHLAPATDPLRSVTA